MLEQITGYVNLVLSPVTILCPALAVGLLAVVFTVLVFVCNRLLVKRELVENIKKRMDEIKEQLTLAQKAKNIEAAEKWMKELIAVNNQYIKNTLKGLVITITVSLLILPWIGSRYSGTVVKLPFELPFVGNGLTGIYWYILVSFVVGMVINKILGGG